MSKVVDPNGDKNRAYETWLSIYHLYKIICNHVEKAESNLTKLKQKQEEIKKEINNLELLYELRFGEKPVINIKVNPMGKRIY